MAYYSVIANGVADSGTADILNLQAIKTPYNYLNPQQNIFFKINTPFSLNFTRYEKEEENPFRLTLMAPDFTMNTVLSAAEFEQVVRDRPLHQHDTYELVYVLKGELFQKIENRRHRYTENSCCLINQNIRHTEEYNTSFQTVTLSISRNFLEQILTDGEDNYFQAEKQTRSSDFSDFLRNEFTADSYSQKKYIDFIPEPNVHNIKQYIYSLLDEITNIMLNPAPGSTLFIKAIIYRILHYLDTPDYYLTESIRLGTTAEGKLFADITHLMEQTNGRISRSELSRKLNYSGNYINHIVQKYTGLSTFEYGISFTMQRAAWLLGNTTKTVSEIIQELGFTDRTHFYKHFAREYGTTPREYRMNIRSSR